MVDRKNLPDYEPLTRRARNTSEPVRGIYRKTVALSEKNDAFAQLQVGGVYKKGRGVAQDDAEVVRWCKLAAAQGNAFA